ncbi:hypothetical protein N7495_005042 [Penicillium taxi]|uniref:uncharacterized protein n=1 Tax=Penicillium taxi TaxID=168475 RepID=UPI0025451258|nr:uncharacterized protein N7495_005042 [Penicillium taxi]KAJ5893351.1 hypothetical protein N7495_005042 [Penicillium taxi]
MATSSDGMVLNFDETAHSITPLQVQNIDFVSRGRNSLSKFTTFEQYNNTYCDLLRTRLAEYETFLEKDGSLALQQFPDDVFAFKFNEHHSRGFHRGGPTLVTQDANVDVDHPVSWVDTIIALNEGKFQNYENDGSSRDTVKGKKVEISEYERWMLEPLRNMEFPSEKDIKQEYKARFETYKDLRDLRASHMKVLNDLFRLESRLKNDCDVLAVHCRPGTVTQTIPPDKVAQSSEQVIANGENNNPTAGGAQHTAPATPATGILDAAINRQPSPSPIPSSVPSPTRPIIEDPDWGPSLAHMTPTNMLSSTRKRSATKKEHTPEKKRKRIRINQTEEEKVHGPEFVKELFDAQLTLQEMVPKYEARFGLQRSMDWIRKFHVRSEERRSSGFTFPPSSLPHHSTSPRTALDQSQESRRRSTSSYIPPPAASSFSESAQPAEQNGGFTPANRAAASVKSPEINGGFTPTNSFVPMNLVTSQDAAVNPFQQS